VASPLEVISDRKTCLSASYDHGLELLVRRHLSSPFAFDTTTVGRGGDNDFAGSKSVAASSSPRARHARPINSRVLATS
jgi:hypothetical protein